MSNTDLANKLEVNPDANKTPAVILIIVKSSKSLVDNRGEKIIYIKEKKIHYCRRYRYLEMLY
jgi:hypothetical protein